MTSAADKLAALGGASDGIFATLGGSNTLGACDAAGRVRCNQTSFAKLTLNALTALGAVSSWANGGIGAMGPQLAAACTNKFAPVGTRFATVEYLPNLGYTNDDAGELAAIEKLLHELQRRGARVALVNIVPGAAMPRFKSCVDGDVGCTTHRHILRLHAMLGELAANYSVPVLTVEHDGPSGTGRFGADLMHLNPAGHAHVTDELLRLYATWPHWKRGLDARRHDADAERAAARMPVTCHLGAELGPLVGAANGFAQANFARDPGARTDKVGWEARGPGSRLTLCAGFPAEPPAQRVKDRPLLSNGGHHEYRYVVAVGLQLSHPLNRPLFGVAHVGCAGACECMCKWSHHGAFNESCYFDGLAQGHATVTAFARLLARRVPPPHADEAGAAHNSACAARDACAITISNSADPDEPRRRVIVRALMMGYNEHHSTKWLNTYHLDGTGLTSYRRQRRRAK